MRTRKGMRTLELVYIRTGSCTYGVTSWFYPHDTTGSLSVSCWGSNAVALPGLDRGVKCDFFHSSIQRVT